MKTPLLPARTLLAGATLLLIAASLAEARPVYGVRGVRGAAVVGEDRAVVATRRGVAVSGPNGTAVARRSYAAPLPVYGPRPLPAGYIRVVPPGYRTVFYGGYNCLFVGGVYYRAVFYGGETVYVVVR